MPFPLPSTLRWVGHSRGHSPRPLHQPGTSEGHTSSTHLRASKGGDAVLPGSFPKVGRVSLGGHAGDRGLMLTWGWLSPFESPEPGAFLRSTSPGSPRLPYPWAFHCANILRRQGGAHRVSEAPHTHMALTRSSSSKSACSRISP